MMNRYLVHYPRNFSNEYEIYAGTKADLEKLIEILASRPRAENGNTCFITRKRAIYLGRTRVNEARRDNEQWFGGFASVYPDMYAGSLDQEIEQAIQATAQVILEYEAAQEGWKAEREASMRECY